MKKKTESAKENTNKSVLSEVPWMAYFRTSPQGQILSKTALVKDNKFIGAYNPFGQLIWIERDLNVILCP